MRGGWSAIRRACCRDVLCCGPLSNAPDTVDVVQAVVHEGSTCKQQQSALCRQWGHWVIVLCSVNGVNGADCLAAPTSHAEEGIAGSSSTLDGGSVNAHSGGYLRVMYLLDNMMSWLAVNAASVRT